MSVHLTTALATSPFSQTASFGTIASEVATGIFSRQSQADLDTCIAYCNRKWPGNLECIRDCHDITYNVPTGIADSSDFFAGAVAGASSTGNDITDLYTQVATPDWARNTGINPGGTTVETDVDTPIISPTSPAPNSSSDSSMWLLAGSVALAGVVAWIALSK